MPPKQSNAIFRKWYKVASKGEGKCNEYWYVVRADKKTSKGTCIGPIQIRGKSWYPVAVNEARRRNAAVKIKRQETEKKMEKAGWTPSAIKQFKADALAEVRKEMGDDYREEDP